MLIAPLLSPDIMEQRIFNWDVPLRCLILYSEFEEIIEFLNRVKEGKPPFVHKIHKRQLNLGDIRQEAPAPVARSNKACSFSRRSKPLVWRSDSR